MIRLEKAEYLGNNTRSFYLNEVVVSQTEYNDVVSEDWHFHVNHHLTLVINGGNKEQRKGDELQALPGKVLTYPQGTLHRNTHTMHPSKNINLEIEDEFLHRNDLDFSISRYEYNSLRILKIYNECLINDGDSKTSIVSLLLNMFEGKHTKGDTRTPPWVAKVEEILNDRWNEHLSLETLSNSLGIHPVSLSKHFSKYFNSNLGEYSRKLKIDKALTFIKQTDKSLTEISLDCGFFDQSHFIRVFKSSTGFTPGEFKNL